MELELARPPPAGLVALGYLRSYDERMGDVHVTCALACTCNQTALHGWHKAKTSILHMSLLKVHARLVAGRAGTRGSTHGGAPDSRERARDLRCTLRLEHVQLAGDKAWGSKFKLLTVVIPPFAIDLADRDLRDKAGAFRTENKGTASFTV